jgi:STE24 endopeptidase
VLDYLNVRHLKRTLPQEFEDVYDEKDYKKSQDYLKDNTGFEMISSTIILILTLAFIFLKGFDYVDKIAGSFNFNAILTGIIFALILKFISDLIELPFAIYDTFVLEEKYGFNKTTPGTFVLDILKEYLLTIAIGAPLFAAVLYIFGEFGARAWLYVWIFITIVELLLTFLAPVLILPLFNKFTPLENPDLKKRIEDYAKSQNFKMKGIFTMDGSRRSSKSNAFFTGFGSFKRIVLFDTMILKHTIDEVVAILAHEMGHYRKKHVFLSFLISVLQTGLMLYIMKFFINNAPLSEAFGMEKVSVYSSLVFFGFLYSPISFILGIFSNYVSRIFEFQADLYSINTFKKPRVLVEALKKLSADNLINLTPHPLKVFVEYSHPPVLERIKTIEKLK